MIDWTPYVLIGLGVSSLVMVLCFVALNKNYKRLKIQYSLAMMRTYKLIFNESERGLWRYYIRPDVKGSFSEGSLGSYKTYEDAWNASKHLRTSQSRCEMNYNPNKKPPKDNPRHGDIETMNRGKR